MAGEKLPTTVDPMLSFFLPQTSKETRTGGNPSLLNTVMAGLQGQDYQNLVAAAFAGAMDKNPALRAQYAHAMGARTGGNASLGNAIARESRRAANEGAAAMAGAQNQNYGIQGQLAGAVFNNSGTKTTGSSFDLGSALARMAGAKGLGMVQDFLKRRAPAAAAADAVTAAPAFDAGLSLDLPAATADSIDFFPDISGSFDLSGLFDLGSVDIMPDLGESLAEDFWGSLFQ